MKIFVTGGSGFLGRPLIKQLAAEGHTVVMLSRQPTTDLSATLLRGNLATIEDWGKEFLSFSPDVMYHLSWEGLPDYSLATCLKNLHCGACLYQLAATSGCQKIVTTGTCWEYGERKGKVTTDAEGEILNLFASSKKSLRLIGESLFRNSAQHFIWARVFFAYGEGQRATSLIPSLVRAIRQGKVSNIQNPHARHDFIYADDVAAALASLATLRANGPSTHIVNIGTGIPHAVEEVQDLVVRMLRDCRKDLKDEKIHEASDGLWCDAGELMALTGWKPTYDLASGIRATLQRMGALS